MPLIKSGSKEALHSNIKEMMKAGHPQRQAIATSLAMQRKHMAEGGEIEEPEDDGLDVEIDKVDKDTEGDIHAALAAADEGFAGGGSIMAPDSMQDTLPMPMAMSGGREALSSAGPLEESTKELIKKKREEALAKMKSKARRT